VLRLLACDRDFDVDVLVETVTPAPPVGAGAGAGELDELLEAAEHPTAATQQAAPLRRRAQRDTPALLTGVRLVQRSRNPRALWRPGPVTEPIRWVKTV